MRIPVDGGPPRWGRLVVRALTVIVVLSARAFAEPPSATANVFYLGVLEEFDVRMGQTDLRPQVRVGFRYDAGGWKALPDGIAGNDRDMLPGNSRDKTAEYQRRYAEAGRKLRSAMPAQATWTVCFDGKVRGKVASVLPERWGPRARGSELLVEGQEPPWAGGRRGDEFTGFQGVPKRRPLVVTTAGRCADPDQWKRVPFDAKDLERHLPALRDELRRVHLSNSESDASLFRPRKAYASSRGHRLLMVMYSQSERPYLFHLSPSGTLRFLGLALSVIDAGDYDGDGRSEVLAMQEGEEDGLILFSSDFSSQQAFLWTWETEE